ncbi:MAG: CAP domain-containing protein [Silicimonas sp.]|nr:CAP domain-containing protein [Silicimonas sp.]
MLKSLLTLFAFAMFLAGCSTPEPRFGPDGRPLPQVYRLSDSDAAKVQFRMLEGVNTLRQARGAQPVELSAQLNAAAKTHSRDMSVQNRPWHFGSDGSSPIQRASRAGYQGRLLGENISETFETELETLSAWMEAAETREVILDSRAGDMGFSWFQEPNGKIWWTLLIGQPNGGAPGGV